MRLWRLSNFAGLSGEGGLRASARWHSRGRRIVYLADHPAAALLETIVHLEVDSDDLPNDYRLLTIEAPDDIPVEYVDGSKLPIDWRTTVEVTLRIGDDWLKTCRTALLRVPSAIAPAASNFLLNPAHPDAAKIKVIENTRFTFDTRLFR